MTAVRPGIDGRPQGLVVQDIGHADDGRSLHESLRFIYFHDTYHTGQTDLLRQVAGTEDKII